MPTIEERIEKLEVKLKQEKAKKQRQEARQRATVAKAERKNDTRRKILIGAVMLAKMDRKELLAIMNSALTKTADRQLFDLNPLTTASNH